MNDDTTSAEQIILRALKDPDFRQRLIASPKQAVEEALGAPLPEGAEVTVHQGKPGSIHLVLPAPPADPAQLSDAELSRVAASSSSNYTSHYYTGMACSC
jgi:hypothetical protein